MEANRFVCGTRAVVERGPKDFRVVCATCGAGGSVRFCERKMANHHAIRYSAYPCLAPGCGAR